MATKKKQKWARGPIRLKITPIKTKLMGTGNRNLSFLLILYKKQQDNKSEKMACFKVFSCYYCFRTIK